VCHQAERVLSREPLMPRTAWYDAQFRQTRPSLESIPAQAARTFRTVVSITHYCIDGRLLLVALCMRPSTAPHQETRRCPRAVSGSDLRPMWRTPNRGAPIAGQIVWILGDPARNKPANALWQVWKERRRSRCYLNSAPARPRVQTVICHHLQMHEKWRQWVANGGRRSRTIKPHPGSMRVWFIN
jgi:hypothetical protein